MIVPLLISHKTTLFQKRLNVVQTRFGQDIGFSMRTFWFDAQTSSVTGQKQTMECSLRLDPVSAISSSQPASSSQPDDCSCHTPAGCSPQGKHPSESDEVFSPRILELVWLLL